MATQTFDQDLASLAPNSASEAMNLAVSPGGHALINTAIVLAYQRERPIGPEQLFVAALVIGMRYLEPPASGLKSALDHHGADPWLYNWFVSSLGTSAVNAFIEQEVRGAFPLPAPSYEAAFDDLARKAASRTTLTPDTSALLARARFYSDRTLGDTSHRYGVRHIFAALTVPSSHNAGLMALVAQRLRVNLSDAAAIIPKNAEIDGDDKDAINAWRDIVKPKQDSEDEPSPTPPQPIVPPTIMMSGFTPDALGTGGTDPLGIGPDVSAFARLICLEQATPPLSICLFGEWGSGKSTFMARLQAEVATLARKNRPPVGTADKPVSDEEPRFVENVVQIKFNAWHFADASLWASLTAVFFDQLRRGGADGGRASDYNELIGRVATRVRSVEADAATKLEKVEDAKRESDTAHKALDAAEKQLAASDLTLAWSQLQSDFDGIRKQNADKLKAIGQSIDRADLDTDTKAFAAAVADAASTPGRIALIGRVLVGGGWPTFLGVAAIVLIGCVGVVLPAINDTIAAGWIQRIVGWGGGSFAAFGALWKALSAAKPILDGAWKYSKAVEDARVRLASEVDTKRSEATKAASKLKQAETELATARAPLSTYRDADSPSTILRYFLFEDGDIRDYDKQVSIVSRARRSFEQLNSIVATTRIDRKEAERRRAAGEVLTSAQKALLEPTDGKGLLVPDRIVLYIDDLDRCTHDQVYDVLQAIHLLLAFELFVVVVGVDVRWIEGAVAKHFEADPAQATGSTPGDPGIERDKQRRKRAIDYLEKIFQIPFWLRRLNSTGSYGAYVRDLLKDNEHASGPSPLVTPAARGRRPLVLSGSPLTGILEGAPADIAFTADAVQPEAEQIEFGAIDAALASMKLETAEIDFLASPAIGAVASKSPRAVKRLINIYRIVRARLSDTELDAFLGRLGEPPQFPVAALLGAIETGQSIELVEALYPALSRLSPDEQPSALWTTTNSTARPDLEIPDVLKTAFMAVDRLCGGQGATAGTYLQMARMVRRYSFNGYE